MVFRTHGDTLAVKPYHKSFDRNTYLHYRSFHSKTLRANIPYGQCLRLKRNTTEEKDYRKESIAMSRQFIDRGYLKQVVQDTAREPQVKTDGSYWLSQTQQAQSMKGSQWL